MTKPAGSGRPTVVLVSVSDLGVVICTVSCVVFQVLTPRRKQRCVSSPRSTSWLPTGRISGR